MTKAGDLQDLRKMFLKLDTTNNGTLSREELAAGMSDIENIFNLPSIEVNAMFDAADTNKDGTVDYSEFIAAAYSKELLLQKDRLLAAFKLFDHDHDGEISKQELQKVFGGG